uniref:Serine protease snake n=3 Tax=Culex pipiens TaxID=7175 RepID=A0A8D8F687_CULPI
MQRLRAATTLHLATRMNDCHTRFHARPVNEYRMAMFEGVSLNGTEFPHLAVVGQRGPAGDVQWKCTGSLISKRFVLTAASCVSDGNVELLVVKVGDVNSAIKSDDKFAQEFGVSNVTVHPSYNTRYQYNDLALVELDKDVVLSTGVCPACIWSSAHYPFNWYEVAGVDMTAAAASKSDSIKVKLSSVESSKCESDLLKSGSLPYGTRHDQFCASSANSCNQNLGGPIQIPLFTYQHVAPFLVGVKSFRESCDGVYQRIAPHVGWIETVVGESLNQTDCVNKYKQCFDPAQMDDETEAVDPYFSRVYLHWDDPKTDNLCGGTLVDYNTVLTSAHCTFNSRGESPTKVSIVNHQAGIAEIERHPDFKQGSLYNDVALIRLDKYVRIAKWIAPVCLPYVEALEGHDTTPETFSCRVPKDGFNDKLQIYIPSKSRCSSNDTVYDEEYMARFPEGLGKRLSCFGTEYRLVPGLGEIDAGGPLLSRDETIIFGVNAYATDCGSFKPLITTDVASLIPWIEKFVLRKQKK